MDGSDIVESLFKMSPGAMMINRPGVAGAVLESPPSINQLIN